MHAFRGILFLFAVAPMMAQNRLTPSEERGKQIFERGTSASGKDITASVAGADRVAASILPCSNCHGHDGQGKPEGGVVPSNITWNALTKPYGSVHTDGRAHPPYTERLLKRAITMGIDPAGNTLKLAMPRFQLTLADSADLVAYIKSLGQTSEPGLTATTVGLGVILPPPSGTAQTSRMIRQAVLGYFTSINASGGIFGRRIELTFQELPVTQSQRVGAVRDFLSHEEIFAIVCGAFTGSETEIDAVLRDTGTPAIGAFAAFPATGSPLNPYAFYLDGGVQAEASALVDLAAERFPAKNVSATIVASDEETSRQAAQWIQARLAQSGYGQAHISDHMPDTPQLVFWLRPDRPIQFASTILIAGSLAGSPAEVWDRSTAAAEIMGEGLTRAGRDLSRTNLLEALESLHEVETSLHVPISFGPHRRIGATRVRVLVLEP